MLEVNNVTKRFGGVLALNDVSIKLEKGCITGLIGPNGAGKSTLFKIITSIIKANSGNIKLNDQKITGLPSHMICRLGIGYVFQESLLFDTMTLFENMLVSGNTRLNNGLLSLLPLYQAKDERELRHKIMETLKLFNLDSKAQRFPGELSYGDQRRALIAHVLINGASLLLLDEPSAGMNAMEREELSNDVLRMKEDGLTILIIEHNLRLIMSICDYLYVLNFGRLISQGKPEEVANDAPVIEAYIGRKRGR